MLSSSLLLGHHIMLSYNKTSRAIATRVKDILRQRGHNVWFDMEDITTG